LKFDGEFRDIVAKFVFTFVLQHRDAVILIEPFSMRPLTESVRM